jgi:hypothetical protein
VTEKSEKDQPEAQKPMPPRVVHLLGGLRAIDDRADVSIQLAADQIIARFSAPDYPQLYNQLRSLNLCPIGAEFLNRRSYRGLDAPDWQCAAIEGGFNIRLARNFWAGARHAAQNVGKTDVADLAGRASTYLDLLPIRILELSNAYNRALRSYLCDRPARDNLFFENTFRPYIDAAIHGFVADAASFRDLIAEAAWKLVLRQATGVTSLKRFRKEAKTYTEPIAQLIIAAAEPGGWLKALSDLRNHITHVAPVGRGSSFQFCQPRALLIGSTIETIVLHYPLLDGTGAVSEHERPSDFNDEAAVRRALERYKAYADTSIDALRYAWETLDKMVDLLEQIGTLSGIRSEIPHLTDADLMEEPTFE